MYGENILGAIVVMFCGFGCGGLFYWIGVWSSKRRDPMGFWTGITVDTKRISDIIAYNQANARMWKQYSIPYWISGAAGILIFWDVRILVLSVILIGLACTVGLWWLIHTYRKIEKQYKIQ